MRDAGGGAPTTAPVGPAASPVTAGTIVPDLALANPEQLLRAGRGDRCVVIGAGPAGLTAALELARTGRSCVVLEATDAIGGISQTVERDGWRFDIGGHRFFTKVPRVEALWQEILGPEDFVLRPRLSRIQYGGDLFDYPLKAGDALRKLGLWEGLRCVASYVRTRLHPPEDLSTFEGWTADAFGWRLYRMFFKTYTEKVWGVPASEIQADWAAQRIKSLNLGTAVFQSLIPASWRRGPQVTSLIEEFHYPRLGPGMMWERAAVLAEAAGSSVVRRSPVESIRHADGMAYEVVAGGQTFPCTSVISSMPLPHLVRSMRPAPSDDVLAAADGLRYRDFLTVALVVPAEDAFPDNWIYIHDPDVRVGRVQNFGAWSPDMVRPGWTCLGMEYFANEGDSLWAMTDEALVELARHELARLHLVGPAGSRGSAGSITDPPAPAFVVRMLKAYPMYDEGYAERVALLRSWLETNVANVVPVGRNGMHRYNNQDHSMLTAMLAVENLLGADHDLWSVNADDDYHEVASPRTSASKAAPGGVARRSSVGASSRIPTK